MILPVFLSRSWRTASGGMVLACGEPVNIWFADTRDIEGKAYGHMLVQLPENEVTAGRMLSYLDEVGVTYKEESQDAYC